MKRIHFLLPMVLLLLTVLIISCEKDNTIIDTDQTTSPTLDERFKSYEIVEIDNDVLWKMLEEQKGESVKLNMENATSNTDIANLSFTLNRIHVQTKDFKFYLIGEGGQVKEANVPNPYVLDGQIDGDKGTAFMIVNNENFRAEFSIEGDIHRLEPLSDHIRDAVSNKYIIYNVNDIITQEEFTCGAVEHQHDLTNEGKEDNELVIERSAGNCLKVEVTFMGDYELYTWKFGYNYNNAFNWMYWRTINAGRMYYSYNGYPINFILKGAYVNTWNGYISNSYDPGSFLRQWQNFTVSNSWFQRGDANILFTGKNIGGSGIGGAAWLKSICRNYGYNWGYGPFGFVKYSSNTWWADIATAHEIGHILA